MSLARQMLLALAAGGAIVLFCHAAARGQSCGSSYGYSRSYSSYSYVAPTYSSYSSSYVAPAKVVVKKDVYAEPSYFRYLLALPLVEIPSYGAAYAPPPPVQPPNGAPAAQQAPSQMQQILSQQAQVLTALDKLSKSVEALSARVEKIERTRQPLPQKQPEPQAQAPRDDALKAAATVSQQKCAACHQKGNESHGGDFVLTDEQGRFVRLTDTQLVSMQRQLVKGKMPKINKRAQEHQITALRKEEADALFAMLDAQISQGK